MSVSESAPNIPLDMLGVLSCITDGVIVYNDHKVLFSNAEGSLILTQTNRSILQDLQFNHYERSLHQVHINIPERQEKLIANCMPTQWKDNLVCIAIIKVEQAFDSLIESAASEGENYVQSRKRLDLLFKVAGDGYWDWYLPTANVFFSPGWKQMLGYSVDEIEPSFKSWINLIHPDDLGHFLVTWSNYMENTKPNFSIEYRIQCKNNEYLWVEAHGVKEKNNDGEVVRLAGFHRDISTRKSDEEKLSEYQENLEQLVTQRTQELELANQKLAVLANQDPLTFLQNRRSFDENLKTQLLVSRRNKTSLCLLLMDIDHFKAYNDEYGHQLGDECIKTTATMIKKAIYRPADMAARYGGEEFVVILQDTDLQGAIKVAQKIQHNMSEIQNLPVNPMTKKPISLSIGIACNYQVNEGNLIELADQAMYASKDNGRNQISYYADEATKITHILNPSD